MSVDCPHASRPRRHLHKIMYGNSAAGNTSRDEGAAGRQPPTVKRTEAGAPLRARGMDRRNPRTFFGISGPCRRLSLDRIIDLNSAFLHFSEKQIRRDIPLLQDSAALADRS